MLTCCNCTESLLTSSIPDLQFDPFAIKLYGPYLEINAIRERPILWDQKQFVEEKEKKDNIDIQIIEDTHPMVVIKLVVKEPSEKRKRRQLLPTPAKLESK